jgi:hypothetical protein
MRFYEAGSEPRSFLCLFLSSSKVYIAPRGVGEGMKDRGLEGGT